MGKKCASLLRQVLVLLLLLCVFPCLSQSAPFSVTGSVHQTGKTELTNENSPGRMLYQSAKPASFKVKVRGLKGKGKGRRLMSIYLPNAGIRAGPSKSGQGGGRNPVAAP